MTGNEPLTKPSGALYLKSSGRSLDLIVVAFRIRSPFRPRTITATAIEHAAKLFFTNHAIAVGVELFETLGHATGGFFTRQFAVLVFVQPIKEGTGAA